MLDGLPPTTLAGGLAFISFGGWALAAYFARLVYTGKLVPRTTYDDKVHEANEWRTEGRIKDQTITEVSETSNLVLRDLVPTLERFFTSLHGRGDREVDK